ncbi:hypothetical protein NPIL_210101 [Nephila pilipes]|uniref:Uncharacterized protein n=1 Tax=Nephila pilipes TaxID=299642 RepID=A0A8X6PD33_NEPPI|nr:hypothetical protein NPIL_210101 [Nephila pilipes]
MDKGVFEVIWSGAQSKNLAVYSSMEFQSLRFTDVYFAIIIDINSFAHLRLQGALEVAYCPLLQAYFKYSKLFDSVRSRRVDQNTYLRICCKNILSGYPEN